MTPKRKLNLKELELQLPSIDSNETKIILGGNDYGDGNGQFDMWYWGGNGGNHGDGRNDDDHFAQEQDQGDLDHFYDDNNGEDWNVPDLLGGHDDVDGHSDGYNDHTGKDYIVPFENLPALEQQSPNYCSAFSMEFIKEMITGVEIPNTDATFINQIGDYYHSISNDWMGINGLSSEYVGNVLEHFFNTSEVNSLDDILSAIDSGNPVFATIDFGDPDPTDSDPTHEGHAVVIVGYDFDNNVFIYADPATGAYGTTDGSDIVLDYTYAITGVKP